ncbi:DUF2066 domain-containing protein [Alteromonas gilva]|uniref:DUF2066 domain-containing protein n=1 Tax=Alteromonas gilva TaxID=2987522 RepID=A0ABT5L453_9ALTE|nr:DUF2066 domain-containing protein [Alteromonas gilva]MDC8831171.1 DUF2066 domain-containing protein [Alteromonas gilva]
MMKFIILLLGVVWLGVSQASSAIDLSSGKVPVKDKSSQTLRGATKSALDQVLIKLTGQEDITRYQTIESIRANSDRFLRAYRFAAEQEQLYLVAEFDQRLIENALIEQGLPIWGSRRPDALMWLVVENEEGRRRIVEDSSVGALAQTIRKQADKRGVPMSLPLMDLDDTLNITGYDVWGLFPGQLIQAASRYSVDYVLAGRIYRNRTEPIVYNQPEPPAKPFFIAPMKAPAITVNQFGEIGLPLPIELASLQMSWVEESAESGPLFTQEEFSTIAARARKGQYSLDFLYVATNASVQSVVHDTLIGDDVNELVSEFISRYANYLGQTYAILPRDKASAETIELTIGNLADLNAFVAVQSYLQNLSVTDQVMLVSQQGTVSTFRLSLLGSAQDFRAILSFDSQLQPLTDAFGQPLEGMHYFWSP